MFIIKNKNEQEEKLNTLANDFIKNFNLEMFELGLFNKFFKTYQIEPLKLTPYGFDANIHLVSGLNFQILKDNILSIQQVLNCILILEFVNNKNKGYLKVIVTDIDKSIQYSPPKIKPNEIHLGMQFSLEPLIVDCNKNCMFLLGGAVGSGKTRFLYTTLLSWILSCSHKEISIFLVDLAKNEFNNFKYTRHVKSYAEDLDELLLTTQYLNKELSHRKQILSKYRDLGTATNIEEYNLVEPNNKLNYCYLLIDEFSILVPDSSDSEDDKKKKEESLAIIKRLSKLGRSLGIFCLLATQKTTKDEIPPILKNMSAVRISFRANDSISSEVILGDNSANGLDDRVAIYSLNGGAKKDYLFSPSLSTSMLNDLLKTHSDRSYPKLNLKLMIKELELKELEFQRLKNKEKINISNNKCNVLSDSVNLLNKSSNQLPYEIVDYSNMKVVKDERANLFIKTEKPKKKKVSGWYALEETTTSFAQTH